MNSTRAPFDKAQGKPQTLREKRQEKRYKEILEAALKLFDEKGYAGASMEDIAEASLLTRAGLYKYFSDKATLLKALRQHKTDDLLERTTEALAHNKTFEEKVRAVIWAMLSFQEANPGFIRILFTAGTLPELSDDGVFEPYAALLTQVIEEGVSAGNIKTDAGSDEVLMMLVSLMFKNAIKRNVLGYEPPTTLAQDAKLIEEIFLRGVLR